MNLDDLDLLDVLLDDAASPRIEARDASEAPASFQQRRLWFLHELEPSSAAYNIATALRLRGPLDLDALQRAFDIVVARHAILRTTFENRDGEPIQRIAPTSRVIIDIEDSDESSLAKNIHEESRRAFDLTRGPLFRARIVRVDAQHHILLLTLHHIIADGWSLGIFIAEVMHAYRDEALPPLRIQYADYAAWQQSNIDYEQQFDYWQSQLRDLPTLNLGTDFRRPQQQTFNGDIVPFDIAPDVAHALKDITRGESTPYMTLLAAFVVLLARYARQHDIVLGTSVAHRDDPDTQSLIGFFVNMLVLRVDASGDPTFRELLARVKRTTLDAFDHADMPYETLVERLQPTRDPSRNPLYQVAFTMLNAPRPDVAIGDLHVEALGTQTAARFDLEAFVDETPNGFGGLLSFNTDLFTRTTIERMAKHYTHLLRSIATNPDIAISKLEIIDANERAELTTPPRASFETSDTIHQRFERAAARYPSNIALRYENDSLTYSQLNTRADALAQQLHDHGVRDEVLVGLQMTRSIDLVIAIIAILKAGGAYVPLDPAYPAERLDYMATDSALSLIITNDGVRAVVSPDNRQPTTDNPYAAQRAAYVIYTSGSTGRPKGVLVTHANVVRLMDATDAWYRFDDRDVWTLFHSYAFDFSVWEMWGALFYGGTLIIVPHAVTRSPEDFYNLLCDERVTVLNQTPSAFRQLIQAEKAIAREGEIALRYVIFGGEALDLASLEPWMDRHGDEQPLLVNMYGITETTVHVTYRPIFLRDVKKRFGSVIGVPIPDLQTYLLDEHLQPVPMGAIGEIYVAGAGVAREYLNRPELTAERMVSNPFGKGRLYKTGDLARRGASGELEFQGRADEQVKIRGFRIELPEIEAVLGEVDGVSDAVVTVREDRPGDRRLVAYIVPRSESRELDTAEWVSQWSSAFDDVYARPRDLDDDTFDIAGWTSSFTGEPIPSREMREWLDHTVTRIRALKPRRVLEIGCGTGMLLYRIAPECESYVATDFSATVLSRLRLAQMPHVRVMQREARDFRGLDDASFDTIIINSVAQYFPGGDYFLDVLEGAFRALAPNGAIFLGDLRDLTQLEQFHSMVVAHRGGDVQQRIAREEELLIDPAFFGDSQVMRKEGSARNELTLFRYDVVLRRRPDLSRRKSLTPFFNDVARGRFLARLVPELRKHAAARLPEYMIPSAFVMLDALPLTPSGKLHRAGLPAPPSSRADDAITITAPRTKIEERLCAIFAEVLGVDRVGVDDHFFAIGGHSLLATQLVSRIRAALQVDLPLRTVFLTPTPEALAREIEKIKPAATNDALPRVTRADVMPLSFSQQRLWFLDQLEPNLATYNIALAIRLDGNLDVARLQHALDSIVARHEILRTTFTNHEPGQRMAASSSITLAIETIDESQWQSIASHEATQPFDLHHGPLLRARLLRFDAQRHMLLVTMHHIITDGWSLGVMVNELRAHYERRTLPPLPIQYADFAHWQREQDLSSQRAYWLDKLRGLETIDVLTPDHPRPTEPRGRGAAHRFTFTREETTALHVLAKHHDATLFMTLLAAFAATLHRSGGATDFAIGVPVANRNRKELEALIGFFVNTLVLRVDASANPTFAHFLEQIRETALDAFAHQDVPFEMLVEALHPDRDRARHPLFQVMFVLQNAPGGALELPGLTITTETIETGISKFDLTLLMEEADNGLIAVFEYDRDLFDHQTIERLANRLRTLCTAITHNDQQSLANISLIDANERAIITSFSIGPSFKQTPPPTLTEAWLAQVARTPNAEAIVFNNERLTYKQLDERASAMSKPHASIVPLEHPRGIEMVTSILATLKHGSAYLPIDPAYPEERKSFIKRDCAGSPDNRQPTTDNPYAAQRAAYVIYTSGSTGTPKGVLITHANACASLQARIDEYGAPESFLLVPSFAFDSSVAVIFGTLCTGGRLIIAPDDVLQDVDAVTRLIERERIAAILLTPLLYDAILDVADASRLASLRLVIVAGEAIPHSLPVRHRARVPHAALYNEYGPTEGSVWSSFARIDEDAAITIGKPIAGGQSWVLDEHMQLAPIGAVGELYIGGPGVARGYHNRPALTAERFLPNPFGESGSRMYRTGDLARWRTDGRLDFLGRADFQLKIRGFRIEPGEIEAVLTSLDDVQQAVVVARTINDEQRLVAYVVSQRDDLRDALASRLPKHMIPSHFIAMDALPLTPNGKIDRNALPELFIERAPKRIVPPSDAVELQLIRIWEDVLGIAPIGVTDDFFDLGGHSLLAVRLIARIRTECDAHIPLVALFEGPTIQQLARVIRGDAHTSRVLVPLQTTGTHPPLYVVHQAGGNVLSYLPLARALDRPVYGLQSRHDNPIDDINTMADHYAAAIRTHQPNGPYHLAGHSLGGRIAFEIARRLDDVASLTIIDVPGVDDLIEPELDDASARTQLASQIRAYGLDPTETDTHLHVYQANMKAIRAWIPTPGTTDITLIVTRSLRSRFKPDATVGWGALTSGRVTVHEVDAEHEDLLRSADVLVGWLGDVSSPS